LVTNQGSNLNEKQDKTLRTKASLLVGTAFLALAMIVPSNVFAAAPHFVGTPTCSTSGSGTSVKTLSCSGKIGGLGNVRTVTAQLVSDVFTACTNRGQQQPSGHQAVAGAPATLPVSNGNTVFTLSVSASANCPPPQVGSVTFSFVRVVVDSTVLPIPGTFDP
jgi:hypothetical protein